MPSGTIEKSYKRWVGVIEYPNPPSWHMYLSPACEHCLLWQALVMWWRGFQHVRLVRGPIPMPSAGPLSSHLNFCSSALDATFTLLCFNTYLLAASPTVDHCINTLHKIWQEEYFYKYRCLILCCFFAANIIYHAFSSKCYVIYRQYMVYCYLFICCVP